MHLIGVSKLDVICHLVIDEALLIKLPDQQKSVAYVFVRCTGVLVNYSMHNLTDLIHKDHDSLLKYLSSICEVSNITEPKDGNNLLSRKHRIDIIVSTHVLRNNLGASFSKPKCEQSANLD